MILRYLLIGLPLISSNLLGAEPLEVTPGLWQIEITSRMPLLPEPTVRRMQQCFKTRQLEPSQIMRNSNNCQFSDMESSRRHLAWQMTCLGHGGEMTGQGRFDSRGDTMRGDLLMAMMMNGERIEMTHHWVGRYSGPCP